jgi:acyl transferase domain-containing protein
MARRAGRTGAAVTRDSQPLLAQALGAIEEMRERIRRLESAARAPIAIIGSACRVPGASDLGELWSLVADCKVANAALPGDRWMETGPALPPAIPRWATLFPDIWGFDCDYFGIPPRQALAIDPQQRLLLELVCEAADDAGIAAGDPAASGAGLFAGVMHNEYADLLAQADDGLHADAYAATGTDGSFATGRISFLMGWRGPSAALNTACSSSLVAVHMACRSLRAGECDLAFAGGVNLILTARSSAMLAHAGALSPDGRCRAFDQRANGFGRGEGGGVIALRRLDDAERAGDRILAVIRGSAMNHDGASGGLTVPCGRAQELLIASALRDGGLRAADIDYVEAHGTGTRLGDPIELHALGSALGGGRAPGRPLLVGSLKGNIGHTEAAAGILGLLKTVAALNESVVPPQPDLGEANGLVSWDALGVQPVRQPQDWPRCGRPRLAGVSSFGMAGTNAHVILGEPPQAAPRARQADGKPLVLTLSARDPAALPELAARTLRLLPGIDSLEDFCWSMAIRRTSAAHRWTFAFSERGQVASQLAEAAAGPPPGPVAAASATFSEAPDGPRRTFVPGPAYPWQRRVLRPSFKQASKLAIKQASPSAAPTAMSAQPQRGDLLHSLAAVAGARKPAVVAAYLETCAETVLGRKLDGRAADRGFQELGFDSISAADFVRVVGAGAGLHYPTTLLFECPTLTILGERILADLSRRQTPKAGVG